MPLLALASLWLVGACSKPALEKTSYSGEGAAQSRSSPPLCLQHRKEARPITFGNRLLVHLNNTCSYGLSCSLWSDVTDETKEVSLGAGERMEFIVAMESEQRRFEVELECARE